MITPVGSTRSGRARTSRIGMERSGHDIGSGTFSDPESSVKTCAASGELLVEQSGEARIDGTFPQFASDLFRRAMTAGYANERLGSLIKVLRSDSGLAATRS
jgi:hypothetical protein